VHRTQQRRRRRRDAANPQRETHAHHGDQHARVSFHKILEEQEQGMLRLNNRGNTESKTHSKRERATGQTSKGAPVGTSAEWRKKGKGEKGKKLNLAVEKIDPSHRDAECFVDENKTNGHVARNRVSLLWREEGRKEDEEKRRSM
jgi:hypothetical protein